MSDAGAAPEWPGGGLMCQAILAMARQFMAAGTQGAPAGMPIGGATPDLIAFLAALSRPQGAADANAGRFAAEFAGQASMIAMASGFRYWRSLMRLFDENAGLAGRVGLAGTQTLSAREQRELADALRGLARQVGDAASQEGRRFALEMERLGLAFAPPPDVQPPDVQPPDAPPHPHGVPHRHVRAKL